MGWGHSLSFAAFVGLDAEIVQLDAVFMDFVIERFLADADGFDDLLRPAGVLPERLFDQHFFHAIHLLGKRQWWRSVGA